MAELRAQMPNNEYHQWRAYLTWKAAMLEQEQQKAAAKAKVARRGR